ncbi:Septin-domain-containing protein [Limtongia smithiae]|uniref:Septin-domain-containing protein n=1 Tax=Limtongia smithiae TaxID=1125753 RepID=UPI0034CE518F
MSPQPVSTSASQDVAAAAATTAAPAVASPPASPSATTTTTTAAATGASPASVSVSMPNVSTLSISSNNDPHVVRRKITSYVGFSSLPMQCQRRATRRGFNFNIMLVGESGLGKSTLVSTLFDMALYPAPLQSNRSSDALSSTPALTKTGPVRTVAANLEEGGVRLNLTVIDTPGFGDLVNNEDAWRPLVDAVHERYDAYLEAENKMARQLIADTRVHACIYFIAPTGHALRPLDIEVMKRLHTKVNLIPVIAKSDILTDEEITSFKARIRADLDHHRITVFETPRYELDSDESVEEKQMVLSKIPFAVIGATGRVQTPDGRSVRGRKYPWGVVEVDRDEHCDFLSLRSMLVKNYMEELREATHEILYENYRTTKLTAMGVSQDASVFKEINPSSKLEEERALHSDKLAKMESEMKMVFQQKVAQKEQKLKQSEDELFARHREMKDQLEKTRRELEFKLAQIEQQRSFSYSEEKSSKKKGFSLRA